ncbi:MAG TPA: toxin [Gammaproteobacteria bacterium]|nr:toxin [Gammaproteobacteria bacterium]
MKIYAWNSGKNEVLKRERNISFEEIVLNIQPGNEVDIYDHPNKARYPDQKVSVVIIENYTYLVPYVEKKDEMFLKTIMPGRKATRQYIGDTNE